MKASKRKRRMAMNSIKGYKAYISISNEESGGEGCKEFLWIERTFGGYRIANIPYCSTEVSFGDIVRIDQSTGEILSVICPSIYRNGLIRYASASDPMIQTRFVRVQEVLEEHEIIIEGITPGVASLAVPVEIADEQFWRIVEGIPEITGAEIAAKAHSRNRAAKPRKSN